MNTLQTLPRDTPLGFVFPYRGRSIVLEAWVDGVPCFVDAGCVRHDYSAAIEAAAVEWLLSVKYAIKKEGAA